MLDLSPWKSSLNSELDLDIPKLERRLQIREAASKCLSSC
jgi:hypothetical protein